MTCKICGYTISGADTGRTKNPYGPGKVHTCCLELKVKAHKKTMELLKS